MFSKQSTSAQMFHPLARLTLLTRLNAGMLARIIVSRMMTVVPNRSNYLRWSGLTRLTLKSRVDRRIVVGAVGMWAAGQLSVIGELVRTIAISPL